MNRAEPTRKERHIPSRTGPGVPLALALAALLAGCGKSSTSTDAAGVTTAPATTTASSCIPINTAQIPFIATNIQFDWANVIGGQLPMTNQPVGQVVLGGSATSGPFGRSGVDGTITMNVTPSVQAPQGYTFPTTGGSYGYNPSGLANATGYFSISAQTQADIAYRVQTGQLQLPGVTANNYANPAYAPYYYPNSGVQTNLIPQICISAIAIDLGHYYYTLYGGKVFLYLNNTSQYYPLSF